ncbi:MAG: AsmA family protein [Bryobacteraceae bacterium]
MKIAIRILGTVVVLALIAAVALPFLIDVNQFRPRLESAFSSALGRPVSIGNLNLRIYSGSVSASDLSIADDPSFGKSPFLQAKSLSAQVELWPLIASRKIEVTGIEIDQPEIVLLQKPTGEWNYSTLGAKSSQAAQPGAPASSSGLDLTVNLVKIADGHLTIAKTSGHSTPLVLDKVNIQLNDFAPASVMPFSLTAALAGGGTIALNGKAGPIDRENAERTPVQANLKIAHLDLVRSGVVPTAAAIEGLIAINGTGNSDGKIAEIKGRVEAENLKLIKGGSPATRPAAFDFTVRHNLATRAGELSQGDIHIGKAEAKLTGTYAPQGDSMALKAVLTGAAMPIPELEGMLPALNIALPAGSKLEGGTANVKLGVEGPIDNLVASGTVGVDNVRLAGFNLGEKMSVIEALAGIHGSPSTEIQTLSADLKNANGATTVENLKLVEAKIGELDGAGTISAERALDFKMRAMLKSGGVLPTALGANARATVPFFIRGTAADPKFEPDLKGMAAAQVQKFKSSAAKAAGGILDGILGTKKKNQ